MASTDKASDRVVAKKTRAGSGGRKLDWLVTLALIGMAALAFMTASSLAAMYQLPIWADAVVGALAFPGLALLWHFIVEYRRRGVKRWLARRDRFVVKQLVVCGTFLTVSLGLARPQSIQALKEHRGWIVGSTQFRTEADCDVRGGRHSEWESSLEAGKARAKRLDKPVLLFLDADWCSYCRTLKREALCAPDVYSSIKDDYVAVKINDRDLSEATRDEFNVSGFPKLFIIAPDGTMRSRSPGEWKRPIVHQWLVTNAQSR